MATSVAEGIAIPGLRGTGDWTANERPTNFRESILFFSPNGDAPLFALTSKMGKKSVNDPEFSWWCESNNLYRLRVAGAVGGTTADQTIIVDSVDPTAGTMTALYGSALHLKPGDLLMVEKVEPSSGVFDNEIIQVDTVSSATQFSVSRGAAGTTPAAINNADFLTLIGSSYAEGTGAPRATTKNPVKFYNYIQIFKDSYEITGTADKTETRTGSAWSNDKKRKMFKHSSDIEWAMLYGQRSEGVGDNGKPIRYMGGLRQNIPQATPANGGRTTIFTSAVSAAAFADAVSPVWDFDFGGGDTRLAYCGNWVRVELGKVIQATTGIRMELGNVIKIYGQAFQEFVMPQGRLMLKSHPLLSRHPRFCKSMFVVDAAAMKYVTQTGRPDGKVKDDVQLEDEDVRRGFIQTDCSLMVDGGGLSMAYLGNISST